MLFSFLSLFGQICTWSNSNQGNCLLTLATCLLPVRSLCSPFPFSLMEFFLPFMLFLHYGVNHSQVWVCLDITILYVVPVFMSARHGRTCRVPPPPVCCVQVFHIHFSVALLHLGPLRCASEWHFSTAVVMIICELTFPTFKAPLCLLVLVYGRCGYFCQNQWAVPKKLRKQRVYYDVHLLFKTPHNFQCIPLRSAASLC